jgi:hypothetical protein
MWRADQALEVSSSSGRDLAGAGSLAGMLISAGLLELIDAAVEDEVIPYPEAPTSRTCAPAPKADPGSVGCAECAPEIRREDAVP